MKNLKNIPVGAIVAAATEGALVTPVAKSEE